MIRRMKRLALFRAANRPIPSTGPNSPIPRLDAGNFCAARSGLHSDDDDIRKKKKKKKKKKNKKKEKNKPIKKKKNPQKKKKNR